jgi:hypothetical protein
MLGRKLSVDLASWVWETSLSSRMAMRDAEPFGVESALYSSFLGMGNFSLSSRMAMRDAEPFGVESALYSSFLGMGKDW